MPGKDELSQSVKPGGTPGLSPARSTILRVRVLLAQTPCRGGLESILTYKDLPAAFLDRWLLEEAFAAPPPVCLPIRSTSDRAWLILLWKEPQAAGQQVVQALIRVRQSLPRSPGITRMRAGEHMQQA